MAAFSRRMNRPLVGNVSNNRRRAHTGYKSGQLIYDDRLGWNDGVPDEEIPRMILFVVAVWPLLGPPSMFFDDELMLVLFAWFANLSFPEIPGSSQDVLVLFTDRGCSEAVSDETMGPGLARSSRLSLVLVSCQEQDAHLYYALVTTSSHPICVFPRRRSKSRSSVVCVSLPR